MKVLLKKRFVGPVNNAQDHAQDTGRLPLSKRSLSNGMVQPFSQLLKLSTISKDVH